MLSKEVIIDMYNKVSEDIYQILDSVEDGIELDVELKLNKLIGKQEILRTILEFNDGE